MTTVWLLVWRSLQEHALATCVTLLSVALASGLAMATVVVNAQAYEAFTSGAPGFDAVAGARGSQLQLVLNSVFHLENSQGNLPWSFYQRMKSHPGVALAIPYAVGDSFAGFGLVGTLKERFTDFQVKGRLFAPDQREAVLGSTVAQRSGMHVGSSFRPVHGLESEQHHEVFTVVGVLEATNSPEDRVIWIPLEAVYHMEGHVLRGAGQEYQAHGDDPIPDEHKEVSAVMLKLEGPQFGLQLDQEINREGHEATLAWPIGKVMAELFDRLGWLDKVLSLVSWLVVVVACGSILASIYNATLARRREFAILRALGARRSTVFLTILSESACLAGLGSMLGLLVYALIMEVAARLILAQTGVHLQVWAFHPILVAVPLGVTGLGALAGLIPALTAYSTDVSQNLSAP